jgi:hypothetical protein
VSPAAALPEREVPQDFWRDSGFHLLERSATGRLRLTDDFLRAYLLRPEIRPLEGESGPHELALHERLLATPLRTVSDAELDAIEDADTRFNYRVLLDFRRRLVAAPDLESCYLGLFGGERVPVPPLFVDQLAHVILRHVLDGIDDPLEARTGELFFREQKASVEGGAVMLADLETVEMHASGGAYGSLGRLLVEAQTPTRTANLDVLDADNAALYWPRDLRHDFVVSLHHGRAAARALGQVMAKWIAHFSGHAVSVVPVAAIDEEHWAWHIGLDAQSSALLNDLWRGEEVEPGRLQRLLALFRMTFDEPRAMRPEVAGRPVYLALAMDERQVLRMKPQNLLLNLPVPRAQ